MALEVEVQSSETQIYTICFCGLYSGLSSSYQSSEVPNSTSAEAINTCCCKETYCSVLYELHDMLEKIQNKEETFLLFLYQSPMNNIWNGYYYSIIILFINNIL